MSSLSCTAPASTWHMYMYNIYIYIIYIHFESWSDQLLTSCCISPFGTKTCINCRDAKKHTLNYSSRIHACQLLMFPILWWPSPPFRAKAVDFVIVMLQSPYLRSVNIVNPPLGFFSITFSLEGYITIFDGLHPYFGHFNLHFGGLPPSRRGNPKFPIYKIPMNISWHQEPDVLRLTGPARRQPWRKTVECRGKISIKKCEDPTQIWKHS